MNDKTLFDIWLDPAPKHPQFPYAAQLVNYVGHFKSEKAAMKFVEVTKRLREKENKSARS